MTATEARQAALIEAAACIIEKACENRGADELTIEEAMNTLENVYEVLALARQAAEAKQAESKTLEMQLATARAEIKLLEAKTDRATDILERYDTCEGDCSLSQTELAHICGHIYDILTA